MPPSIADQVENLLKDDRNFSTRNGLRFTLELIRDAFRYIEAEKEAKKQAEQKTSNIDSRLGHVEQTLKEFLDMRENEKKKAEEERTFYRRAVIGGIISIFLTQIVIWFSTLSRMAP